MQASIREYLYHIFSISVYIYIVRQFRYISSMTICNKDKKVIATAIQQMDSNNIYNIRKNDILLFFDTSFKMILYRDRDGITLFLFYLKSTFQKMCPIKQMKIVYLIHYEIFFAKRKELSNIVKYLLHKSSQTNFICMQVCFYFFILFIFFIVPTSNTTVLLI